LVPLDGSPLAELIVLHARVWAHTTGSRLTLLKVIPPPAVPDPLTGAVTPGSVPYPTWASRQHQAQVYLNGVAGQLTANQQPVVVAVREGEPATQIVAFAAAEPNVIGIAMATHGWGGWAGWLLGSQAEQVLHNAPRPLLLVHPQYEAEQMCVPQARPYRIIVVPLDGTPEAERALPTATILAAASGARLRLVTVVAEPVEALTPVQAVSSGATSAASYLAELAARPHAAGVPVETILIPGAPAAAIVRYCAAVNADLLVMATHGPGGVERLLHPSVAAQLLQQARLPLLLIRQ
jgi:nucleotide-binding universal stress UspA family protein